MPADARGLAIHASAVAIDGEALLVCGASRSGKSRLTLALVARSTPRFRIGIVGDDRILLRVDGPDLVAAPHPRIAGFVERRGLGIVAMPWTASARVGGVVLLGGEASSPAVLAHLPCLLLATGTEAGARADDVLRWWRTRSATKAPHLAPKARTTSWPCAKD